MTKRDSARDYETPGNPYIGMTINERLRKADLYGAWGRSGIARNRQEMIGLLLEVGISELHAYQIVNVIFVCPEIYGF